MPLMDDVTKLKAQLAELISQQDQQQADVMQQLAKFSQQLDALTQQVQAQTSNEQPSNLANNLLNPVHESSPIDLASSIVADKPQYSTSAWERQTANVNDSVSTASITTPQSIQPINSPARQSALSAMISQLANAIGEFSASALAPLSGLTDQAKQFYQHYQAKGLGPVFLMTVAGIITLTLGFGYLLQFSINNWLSELAKALFGLGVANSIIAGGIFIRHKRAGMEDFGSGLVGLGLILNYLCLYFLGPYFNLIPDTACFGLLLLNTLLGYGLSFKLDTKVVAIIALLGGSLAPLMLLDGGQAPLLYLPYLLLIGICSMVQSHKLAWPILVEVTALLHIACIQVLSVFILLPFDSIDWQIALTLVAINGLFYLYSIASLLFVIKSSLTPRLLAVPVALMIFILYTLTEWSRFAGELFAVNALLCTLLYWALKRDKDISALALAFAGSFAGFAALFLLSAELMGLVLLLEGLLLLWIGCKHRFSPIRAEAYVLLVLGIISSFINLLDVLTQSHYPQQSILSYQALLSLSMLLTCALTFMAQKLISQYQIDLMKFDRLAVHFIRELLGVLYSVTILVICYFVSDEYWLNTLPLISLLLIYMSAKHTLRFSEVLAWLVQIPLLGLVIVGMVDANSLSFTDQAMNAKLARIELFIGLLLAYYWYKKYYVNAKLIRFAYYAQLLCYLALPLLLLPKIMRSYPDYIAIALWCSSLVSLGLAYFVNHKSLRYETQILTVLAIMITTAMCLAELWQGFIALVLGLLFIGFISWRYVQLSKKWQLATSLQWHIAPYYMALVIAVLSQTLTSLVYPSWAITALVLCGYFSVISERDTRIGQHFKQALAPGYSLAYAAIYACSILPIFFHTETQLAFNLNNMLINVAELGVLALLARYLLKPRLGIRVHSKIISRVYLTWAWHALLVTSYVLWSYQFNKSIAAPMSAVLLVVHASVVMFISLRPHQASLIRLATLLFAFACIKVIFVDMASFELIQKIVAFMLIGVILLTVAYFYQKAKNRQLTDSVTI
ncbi:DUF2339 domain-containing protein [Shewanella inventionis]|uniref:DUF2339 domain-containing protein n=1 Tax=Shewanella inventionis TaxID=1738770 RepID=A0ABQ1JHP2_9GAMM|nr:DUF2339 domain-containing protein [Shewanella inventionis]MCL1159274.1 DUF2339 domain-containing protein [Shewanella inventionis]UAL43895.1 DUF2339 domain-containing protein [Shewanella inventionis]GGB69257.1 hypothetical protein GCM10011607_32360 [Shewanella inventionis]